jgi:imidazolonepropionase-like amidohydrolase
MADPTIRIEAGLLIPGRGEPVERATVIIEGATISYAGTADAAPTVEEAVVIEVATVMPGLWDCHIHFMGATRPSMEVMAATMPVQAGARSAADLAALISGGVTSVREVGGYGVDLASIVSEGTLPGPTIYGAGAILSTTGGHADVHSLPLDYYQSFLERQRSLGRLCDGVPECLRAVREQLRRNARVIKLCASGGVLSEVDHPIHQQFSEEELKAIVAEAARAERVVAAHCHGKPGIMAALRAGVKTIEHGSYLDEEAAELMINNEAVLVPTRFVIDDLLGMEEEVPAYAYRKLVAIADQHAQGLKTAIAAGVRIATGTDLGTSGPVHGHKYATAGREIRYLIEAGLPPLEAIEAATANGPLTLGPQGPHSGVLEAGYDADVIALDADPFPDPSLWGDPDRVTHVWKAGKLMKGSV